MQALLSLCAEHDIPTTVLGSGFNVLVREGGIRGVVLRLKKLRRIDRCDSNSIAVEAGASPATTTRYCIEHALTGMEFAAGIPIVASDWHDNAEFVTHMETGVIFETGSVDQLVDSIRRNVETDTMDLDAVPTIWVPQSSASNRRKTDFSQRQVI